MNEIYRSIGITKQAFHQRMNRWLRRQELEQGVVQIIEQVREDHPRMSVKKIYAMMQVVGLGLNRFTAIAREHGLMIEVKRNQRRTTNSLGVTRFADLVTGREVTGVNQIWVSDITYVEVGNKFCYATLIMDAYSRRILGYSVSKSLRTVVTTIPALKHAFNLRGIDHYQQQLIMHSDGGGQYYSKAFTGLTQMKGVRNSMGRVVYDNAKAERVIGTLKIEYLNYDTFCTIKGLRSSMERAVTKYNEQRPHNSLNGKTPLSFELSTNSQIFTKEKRSKKENHINDDNNMFIRKTVNAF